MIRLFFFLLWLTIAITQPCIRVWSTWSDLEIIAYSSVSSPWCLDKWENLKLKNKKHVFTYEGLSWAVVQPAHKRINAAHWVSLNLHLLHHARLEWKWCSSKEKDLELMKREEQQELSLLFSQKKSYFFFRMIRYKTPVIIIFRFFSIW
jgi:hypothetical protein